MATKLDREKMYGSVYDKQYFSDEDLEGYQKVVDAAIAGKTSWEDANRYANETRAKYGYSGGEDGSKYIKLADAGEKFTYADAPTYTRKRAGQISALTDAVLGRKGFSYDPEKDPLYQQYRDSYTRQGRQAMEDTLGKVSARTGGLASSYASQAAQQTYDQYMAALADRIPELRQLAYQMYQDENQRQLQNIALLRSLDEDERQDYLTALSQYNADRGFSYGQYADDRDYAYKLSRDAADDAWRQKEWDYGVARDQKADEWQQKEWDYNVGRDQKADEWQQKEWDYGVGRDERSDAEKKAATLAAAGDFSGYRDLGYTDEEIAGLKKAYEEAKAAAKSGGYRGGGDGGKDLTGVLDRMAAFEDDDKAQLYLIGLGLSNDKTDAIWTMYQNRGSGSEPGNGFDAVRGGLQQMQTNGTSQSKMYRALLDARDNGLVTDAGFRELSVQFFPEFAQK